MVIEYQAAWEKCAPLSNAVVKSLKNAQYMRFSVVSFEAVGQPGATREDLLPIKHIWHDATVVFSFADGVPPIGDDCLHEIFSEVDTVAAEHSGSLANFERFTVMAEKSWRFVISDPDHTPNKPCPWSAIMSYLMRPVENNRQQRQLDILTCHSPNPVEFLEFLDKFAEV